MERVHLVVAVAFAVLLGACAPEAPRSLVELERMALLPIGRSDGTFGLGRSLSEPIGTDRELLIDLFEASRDDYAHWFGGPPPSRGLASDAADPGPGRGAWPAFFDFDEARAFAKMRGMRLPTVAEWLYAAAGSAGNRFPWGRVMQSSVANTLELALDRPVAVGTFENGRSTFGCYDMLGNVWEWVEGRLAPNAYVGALAVGPDAATVMGGSYLWRARELWDLRDGARYFADALPPKTRGPDIGARCVADAAEYLRAKAGEWAAHRSRVFEVGRRFGPRAAPFLERLAAEPGSPSALRWLAEGARS